ncbi:Anaphase-promoting complex (APC), subunit 11 [Handroanthus impetiginosus]|uniref:RING-type E3 ubiquitin transferase n=1 Tax=Handroanthus impetiginosus TaxID=429701 RepID=A0A2G9G2U8_9LAMI|nr:Anaphase-promoting complex (APC), subunit 11 [Handroanthus impetiginosus]PIN07826.1 Anaphase-promoting complex (APC), subunit 11 [Handroanthus impetiginosus]
MSIHEKFMNTHRYYLPRMLIDSNTTIPPTKCNATNYTSCNAEANLDANMVIVLVVFLCALICALGLNSILRCFLRCTTTIPQETTAEIASRSLEKEALNRIPVVVFKAGLDIMATDCAICLGEFVEGEDVRILPRCNHAFHVKCVDRWLVLHSSCPTCRHPLIEHSCSVSADDHVRIQID